MNTPRPVRSALIGVSGYGGVHLQALQNLQNQRAVELVAATIINPAAVPEKCAMLRASGCRIYGDYLEMLRRESGVIELCCIPTGIGWHAEMTVAALQAGCHVLVEKPAAGTVQEVDRMIAARDAAGRSVAVGFQHLYLEEYEALKKRVFTGEIGTLREIRISACWPRPVSYYVRNDWAGRLRCGDRWVLDSPANNAFSHFLMAGLHLASSRPHGAANVVEMQAETYRAQEIETFDTIAARFATDTGVEILFAGTHCAENEGGPVIDLIGAGGMFRWEVGRALIRIRPGSPPASLPMTPLALSKEQMFARVLAQIRDGEPERCTLEEARRHTHLINALHETNLTHDIPEEHRLILPIGDKTQHVIRGISATLGGALAGGKLFSELGEPWAVGARREKVLPMTEFRGVRRPVAVPLAAPAGA